MRNSILLAAFFALLVTGCAPKEQAPIVTETPVKKDEPAPVAAKVSTEVVGEWTMDYFDNGLKLHEEMVKKKQVWEFSLSIADDMSFVYKQNAMGNKAEDKGKASLEGEVLTLASSGDQLAPKTLTFKNGYLWPEGGEKSGLRLKKAH